MMLHVVGGTYLEHCLEPSWFQLFGSGVRAAAAARSICRSVRLYTYVEPQQRAALEVLARTFRFSLLALDRPQAVTFTYLHGLARPEITPPVIQISEGKPLAVTGHSILRFGMLEGLPKVHGDWVVYDPQSPDRPQLFSKNGSTAKHLAIVANYVEAQKLTGLQKVHLIGKKLLAQEGAEAVIVKQGPKGASVITRHGTGHVPAFRTEHVWPLGSGDVFSACFASLWANGRTAALTAAHQASLAAAYYCNSRILPFPTGFLNEARRSFMPFKPKTIRRDRPLIYLAGPFFTMAQRWLISEARDYLNAQGLKVFSPYHDVGHGSASDVVPADIAAIRRSSALFAILDGLDSGTLFEIGFARAIGTPVIALAQSQSEEALKMLKGTHCIICDDFATAVYQTAWAAHLA